MKLTLIRISFFTFVDQVVLEMKTNVLCWNPMEV